MSVTRQDGAALAARPAEPADARRLWDWANDPVTRAQSFSRDPIPWDQHVAWLRDRLRDPDTALFVVQNQDGDAVGQARFDRRSGGPSEVSVTLAPGWRGRGYAAAVLTAACRTYRQSTPEPIVAYIKPTNEPSLRAFARAGFAHAGTACVRGEAVVQMTLEAHSEP